MARNDQPLTLLPQTLRLAKASKEAVFTNLKPLLQALLFAEEKCRFLRILITHFPQHNLHLIYRNRGWGSVTDEDSLEHFAINELTISDQRWRAIEIYEGESAINETGFIRRYSEPLAKAGIQIIYLSTYLTDLILVEEQQTSDAISCLQGLFPDIGRLETPTFVFVSDLHDKSAELDGAHSILVSPLPARLSIASFRNDSLPSLTHALLKLILFSESDERFLSITSYKGETSMIIEESELRVFDNTDLLVINSASWHAIRLQPILSGTTGTGVVTSASTILADQKVSIFYLSTFSDDYILIPFGKMEEALHYLQHHR